MQVTPRYIINQFKNIQNKLEYFEELKEEKIVLSARMYNAKGMTIKQEHELGNNDFSNAYKTPMLNEIDRMDFIEKECISILKEITNLYSIRDKCSHRVIDLINNVYINKNRTMRDYSNKIGVSQVHLNRLLNDDLQKIIDNV